ncbi:RHS repeat domain-containing protein, partial [Muribaculum intestinale]
MPVEPANICELSEFYLHFNRRTHIFAKTLKPSPAMMGKHSKTFSGTAPASKAASLPSILWPPVSDRDSMTAIQAYTRQTPYEYCGNYEYIRGKLSRINTPTGYYENGRHYFYVKDYQGNVRCTVADNDSLTKAVHYYPGGSLFGESYGYYFWSGNNLFQGGKLEKSDAHTFYDLQNRHYDPILPHFISVDSKSESYYPFSFYNYALCNPVRYRDPDGNDAEANVRGYTIIITADIYIYNSEYIHKKSATQDLVQLALLYQKAIDSTWGQQTQYEYNGVTYNIVWNINVKIKKINQILQQDGTSNFLFVMHKNIDPNKYPSEVTSCWKGKISSKRIHEISHELGHMLGLRDRYNSKTKKSYNGWENNIMGSENGIIDSRNLSGIIDPILENYHGTEMQKNALKHTWLNKLRIWDY